MKLGQVHRALYLAQVQCDAWGRASTDQQLSFELGCLWFLNQAQNALVDAVREHHGLRGPGDEVATRATLAARDLPSGALDQVLAWPLWSASRKALASAGQSAAVSDGQIALADQDQMLIRQAAERGYRDWCDSLQALLDQLSGAYAEY